MSVKRYTNRRPLPAMIIRQFLDGQSLQELLLRYPRLLLSDIERAIRDELNNKARDRRAAKRAKEAA